MSVNKWFPKQKGLEPHGKVSKVRAVLHSRGREFHKQGATTKKTLFLATITLTCVNGSTKTLSDDLRGWVG